MSVRSARSWFVGLVALVVCGAYHPADQTGWGYRKIIGKHYGDLQRFSGIGGCLGMDCIIATVIARCISNPAGPQLNTANNTWKIVKPLQRTDLSGRARFGHCTLIVGNDNHHAITLY